MNMVNDFRRSFRVVVAMGLCVLIVAGIRASAAFSTEDIISESAPAGKPDALPTTVVVHTPTPIPTPTPVPTVTPTPLLTPSPTPAPPSGTFTMPESLAAPSKVVRRGSTDEPNIAFTFDDGGDGMRNILEILDRKGIKATFFLTAGELQKNPGRWREAVENGHQICNHTLGHRMDLANLSNERIEAEILGWERIAASALGDEYLVRMKREFPYFRSPGGARGDRLMQILGNLGYPITVYWTVEDIYSAKHNPSYITIPEHYRREAGNGVIYLMHSGNHRHVETIIDLVEAQNYRFCLLPEILK